MWPAPQLPVSLHIRTNYLFPQRAFEGGQLFGAFLGSGSILGRATSVYRQTYTRTEYLLPCQYPVTDCNMRACTLHVLNALTRFKKPEKHLQMKSLL